MADRAWWFLFAAFFSLSKLTMSPMPIDELSDNETYGHQLHVPDSDLGDYPENDRHYDGSGGSSISTI